MSKPEHVNFSRRDFLKTAGVGGLATAVTAAGEAEVEAQSGARIVGPGDVPVTLTVNGKRLELRIEPRVTLLDAVRNRADLTGNKRVCDRGACGACTMIVDGRTVYSCSTLAIEVQGKQIRTVDGLAAANGTLHPVQQAFCDKDALMCGFCTPGFVMATVALIEKHPNPTLEQAKRVSMATSAAAAPSCACSKRRWKRERGLLVADPKYAWPTKPTLLGTHVKRLDGPDKVTGRARYTYDINRPGMIYGVIVRSPHPHARIVSIDVSAAEKSCGLQERR
jgi:xanthine dehydrogenase YagT iron-sulfur-binding subunit